MTDILPKILQILFLLLSHYYWAIILISVVVGLFALAKVINAVTELVKAWRAC
jgi:hypothetical protein